MIASQTLWELREPFISAASGLIRLGQNLYIVADDENFLGVYNLESRRGELFTIFNEKLPEEKKLRKKVKKDFESLVYLPQTDEILVVPSGSTDQRMTGAFMSKRGEFLRAFSFESFYKELLPSIPELNIEGTATQKEEIFFFQRGNGKNPVNALIRIKLNDLLNSAPCTPLIRKVDLGLLENVPLSFTDATEYGKNMLFLAAAEASESTYLDGDFLGAVMGVIDSEGRVLSQERLGIDSKPEGLCLDASGKHFYLVTDDDDRSKVSRLFKGSIPSGWETYLV